ncbi:AAWKG family protein [Streptomyces sp. DH37]|uniref:AAWKG family protein n=1 Tax=Streptomyces sp. DH37 TaxID=3040122 RepID=UPI00244147AF|nr:AAWKG family protein [Streptomyces sp. DH37]MDG9706291.1 AAWKG family protein [Streptomyces sp. DH37]
MPVHPAHSNDDYWHQAVRLFTGYELPQRQDVFDELVGNDGIPLMQVEISEMPSPGPEEDLYVITDNLYWRANNSGSSIEDMNIVVPFYFPKNGSREWNQPPRTRVKLMQAAIRLLGSRSTDAPPGYGYFQGGGFQGERPGGGEPGQWSDLKLSQYSYGGGLAMEALLWGRTTANFEWNGIHVAIENAVDYNSFDRAADAFTRAAIFFESQKKELERWHKRFGDEDAAWKGQAAGVFMDLISKLDKMYEEFSADMPRAGAAGSRHAEKLKNARANFVEAVGELKLVWNDWQFWRGNPLRFLHDILLDLTEHIWNTNIKPVSLEYESKTNIGHAYSYIDMENPVAVVGSDDGEFVNGHPDYGHYMDLQTWKRVGEKAIANWQDTLDRELGGAAKTAIMKVKDSFSVSLEPVSSKGAPTLSQSLTHDINQRTREQAEKDREEQRRQQEELKREQEEQKKELERKEKEREEQQQKILEEERAYREKEKEEQRRRQEELDARQEEKEAEQERRQQELQARQEAKQAELEAKQEAKEAEQERRQQELQARQEQKQAEQERRQEELRAEQERKQQELQAQQERRQQELQTQQEARQAELEAKQAEREQQQREYQEQQQQAQTLALAQARADREKEKEEQRRRQEELDARQEEKEAEQERKREELEAEQEEREREQERKQEELQQRQEERQRELEEKQEQQRIKTETEYEERQEEQERRQQELQAQQEARQAEQERRQEELRAEQERRQQELQAQQEARQAELEAGQAERERQQREYQEQQQERQEELQRQQQERQEELQRQQEKRQEELQQRQEEQRERQLQTEQQRQQQLQERFEQLRRQGPSLPDFDDSRTILNPDGSVTTGFSDGGYTTVDPDERTSVTVRPDGSVDIENLSPGESIRNPDGSWTTLNPDGTLTTDYPDGRSVVIDPDEGQMTTTYPDGRTETTPLTPGVPASRPDHGTDFRSSYPGYEEELYDSRSSDPYEVLGGQRPAAAGAQGGPPMMPMMPPGMTMGGQMSGGADSGGRVRNVYDTTPVVTARGRNANRYRDEDVAAAQRGGATSSGMPFMPPMGGAGAPPPQSQESGDRERSSWLAEDEDVWGTDEGGAPAVIGR